MPIRDNQILRTVRTTSFNNEVAAELLRELCSCNVTDEQARRIRCAARQLLLDADALECVWQELTGEAA
ncbi:hypothetical protein UB43_00285 [Pseudomonas sp. 21]|uniref:hypothetical protein n=1 Tax=unclassified Pseudomonas TaxID=196821 RepID=UPI0005EB8C20|nr:MULTISPECIES: hypothetical protein [unclassified Pseudomonas]KJK03004.1 hypothetical protein UB43_00285 [Pseudomonas sp. 21]MBV7586037.1 hypothetical protein [Pseudomonas sp. PDM33]